MKNDNALITVGILNTYSNLLNKGYVALLQPFILTSLPKNKDEEISIEEIQQKMQGFGFSNFPQNVVEAVLRSISKQKNNQYVYVKNKHYYVNKIYDDTKFNNNRTNISNSIESVLSELVYYIENKYGNTITTNEAQDSLINFLNDYGFITVSNIMELCKIHRNDKSNFRIAHFILDHSFGNDKIYKELLEIVKGFFVYKCIYYFSDGTYIDNSAKLQNVDVYLDTTILLKALGFTTKQEQTSILELIKIINSQGGKVKAFDYNVDEVTNILTVYRDNFDNRLKMRLELLDSYDLSSDMINMIISNIKDKLEQVKIDIDEECRESINTSENLKNAGFIDCESLKCEYIERLKNANMYDETISERRIDNDIKSIQNISIIRRGKVSKAIEKCKAIFLTESSMNVNISKLAIEDGYTKDKVPLCQLVLDFSALLWLKTAQTNSEIPALKLLECAYSATRPSDEVLNAFIKIADSLKECGEFTENDIIFLKHNSFMINNITQRSQNDPNKVTKTLFYACKNDYDESVAREINLAIQSKDNTIRVLELTNKEKEYNIENIKTNLYYMARNKKECWHKRISRLIQTLYILVGLIIIISITSFNIYDFIQNNKELNMVKVFVNVVVVVLGVISYYDLAVAHKRFLYKIKNKVASDFASWIYDREINKIKTILK